MYLYYSNSTYIYCILNSRFPHPKLRNFSSASTTTTKKNLAELTYQDNDSSCSLSKLMLLPSHHIFHSFVISQPHTSPHSPLFSLRCRVRTNTRHLPQTNPTSSAHRNIITICFTTNSALVLVFRWTGCNGRASRRRGTNPNIITINPSYTLHIQIANILDVPILFRQIRISFRSHAFHLIHMI